MTDEEPAALCDHFPEIPPEQGEAIVNFTPVEEQDHALPSPE